MSVDDLTGGCYCGAIRYRITARPVFKAQCHCRACQHFSGGGPNYFMLIPPDGFAYIQGRPSRYARPDLPSPRTREFCATCGTHLTTIRPHAPEIVVKVGTLDDPAVYGGPKAAIYTEDMQPFHLIPEGLPAFEKLPK
ncbi:MAG: GFA family protein [Rhodobacter sp.]|nr:GFA family protein [Rhodobacter sp.]